MKFIVSSSALLKQLSGISGVITTNPLIPILENFLFSISDNTLTLTASDLQTSMIAEMEIDSNENGSIAIPAKILMETLRNLPEQPVTFSIDVETKAIEISSDNGRYKLTGENADDYPKIPNVTEGTAVDISSDVLVRAISNTLFCTSNDELRAAMTGVYINFSDSNTTFVATDGHRLVRYRRVDVASAANTSIIIPRKALNMLKAVLPGDNTNVLVEFNKANAFFSFNNIKMICRLIDERYPEYENVIPLTNNIFMTMERQDLLSTLKRISIYANKTTYQVRLRITGSELMVSAEDVDFASEANERLACEHEGNDIEIGFNAKFLIEILNTLDCKTIEMQLMAPNKAGLILPKEKVENEDLLTLIMPVTLYNSAYAS